MKILGRVFAVLLSTLIACLLIWAESKPGSKLKQFPATKVTYWPVQGSDVVAPGHIEHWPQPTSIEAVNAAPGNHKVLYEDDRVRLLEVTILPGEKEPTHGHAYPSVFAFDAVQPMLHDLTPDGKTLTIQRGLLSNDFPAALAMGPQLPHSAMNADKFPQHFYRLEFKKVYGKEIEKLKWTRNGNTIVR